MSLFSYQTSNLDFSPRLPFRFVIISILSSIIHLFTQSTRLVPKTSSPALPALCLSTAARTPSLVGSLIPFKEERSSFFFAPNCFSDPSSNLFPIHFFILCVVCIFLFGLISYWKHFQSTNSSFLSRCMLVCLSVLSYLSEGKEVAFRNQVHTEKNTWMKLMFHRNRTEEAQRRLCPLPGENMSHDPFCQTRGTILRPGYTGLIQSHFLITFKALSWFTKADKISNVKRRLQSSSEPWKKLDLSSENNRPQSRRDCSGLCLRQ